MQDEKQRKKVAGDRKSHFSRGPGNTVFVPADRIVFMDSDKSSKGSGSDTTKKAPDGGVKTRSSAAGKGRQSSVDKSSPVPARRTKVPPKIALSAEPDSAPAEKFRFNKEDRVVMHSTTGVPVPGTVRWVGYLTISKESKEDQPVLFAGIETVSAVLKSDSWHVFLMISLLFL